MLNPEQQAAEIARLTAALAEAEARGYARSVDWLAAHEDISGLPDCYQPRAVAVAMQRASTAIRALAQKEAGE